MAEMQMIVDTAVTIPVNIAALIDDTDFKTREEALTYDQAGMDLVWNFQTAAGVQTQTAVTPTTGGDYDWTHVGNGMYKIEMTASGGASANNDTEGFGWFTGFCTGVLPWRSPVIQFSPAIVVNSLVVGSDNLQVDAIQISGDATAADNLELDYDGTGLTRANSTIGTCTLVTTTTTNTDMLTAAAVNAEVVDVMKTDTISELGVGVPATTPTFETAIQALYMALTKKLDVTAGFKEVHNNAGTVIFKKALSDDGTTYSEAKAESG